MKNTFIIALGIVVLVAVVLAFALSTKKTNELTAEENPLVTENSIVGCYVATLGQDVYSLSILSQQGESFNGTLVFKNFQKDSSSGTYNGTYRDGILLGDYSFQSEGMYSVMQVIFKKVGDNFVRGYGEMNEEGNRFANLNAITYDGSAVFVATEATCAVPSSI